MLFVNHRATKNMSNKGSKSQS